MAVAIAIGPKAGTIMTTTRSLTIQRCMVLENSSCRSQLPVAGTKKPADDLDLILLATGSWVLATAFLYHFPVRSLAQQLLEKIRKQELIKAGDRVGVAVSGGADSVALLLLLDELRAELGIVLSAVHVNHKLRGQESDEDERFVAALAQQHGLEFHTRPAPLAEPDSGIEAAARKLRYDIFRQLAREGRVSKIATAHTLDDQAETVLLRMMRGAGIRGLAGIHPRLVFEDEGGEVIRPLLSFRRADVAGFLRERQQPWHEDSSNRDLNFLRNRVRHRLLPLLKEDFGPAAVENLADLAEIARAEEEHWEKGHPEIRAGGDEYDGDEGRSLALSSLAILPVAAQRRMIRGWLEVNAAAASVSFRLLEEVRDLALGPSGKKLELSGGYMVRRTQRELCLERTADREESCDYEYRLTVPGQVDVPELGVRLEAVVVERESVPQDERAGMLDPAQLRGELVLRNWRPGDRFWPAHTKDAKKVKDLLNDRHIVGAAKVNWPVALAEGCGLVWMRGFPAPAEFEPTPGSGRVLLIRVIVGGERQE